jgi:hypothetical protein
MKRNIIRRFAAVLAFAGGLAPLGASAEYLVAKLSGGDENPSNTSFASGYFALNFGGVAISNPYTLAYRGLEGNITQAHIHLGAPGINGPITIWLCQTLAAPAPAAVATTTPTCPGTTAGVLNASGTNGITADKVLGVAAQRLDAGNLTELLVNALRTGSAYVNVHTTTLGGGEIRGQIR